MSDPYGDGAAAGAQRPAGAWELSGDPQAPQEPYPAWAPPAQDENPWGQPAWGQPSWGQPSSGLPAWGTPAPPPPPRRTSPWVWIGLSIAVVAVIVGAVTVLAAGDDASVNDAKGTDGRTLVLPSSVDGYSQLTSFDTSPVKRLLGNQLSGLGSSGQSSVEHAQIGVYSTGGANPELVFIGLQVSDIPELKDQVKSRGVAATVKSFVNGANNGAGGSSPASVNPGPKGGSMRCLDTTLNGNNVGVCGWGDRSIFAMTIVLNPVSADRTATVTRDLRAAAEH